MIFLLFSHLHCSHFYYLLYSQKWEKLRINYYSFFFHQDLTENCQDFVDSPDVVFGRWEHDLLLLFSNFRFLYEPVLSKVCLIKPFSFFCLVTIGNFYIFIFSFPFSWVAEKEEFFSRYWGLETPSGI